MRNLLLAVLLSALPVFAQQPIVVGAALPQSGILADLASDMRKALLLWQEEVNAAGGLLGRRVELQLPDDHSESINAGKLYEQLIQSKVDFLIGPFGSAATPGAAAGAERNRPGFIKAAGAARTGHRAANPHIL